MQQTKRQPETAFLLPLNIMGGLAAFPCGCHTRQAEAFAKPGLFRPTFSGSLPPGIEGYLKNKSASSALLIYRRLSLSRIRQQTNAMPV